LAVARAERSRNNAGQWRFAGISMLLPVYEDIEDGAEILWNERGLMRIGAIRKLTKTKRQLPVFDDMSFNELHPFALRERKEVL